MKKIIILSIALLFFAAPVLADVDQEGDSNSAASSNSGASVHMGDSYYEGNKRGVNGVAAPAGELTYPGMPGRFDAPPERYGYMNHMKVKDILEYDEEGLTIEECENMRQDDTWFGKRIIIREKYGTLKEEQRGAKDLPIAVHYEKVKGMQSLGVITVVSDDKKSVSADVFAEVVIRAWELGATAIHVKAEGFQREVHTEGAGIGFTWTGVTIDGNATEAMTGVLGAGKSWGQAGYYDHPFITVIPLADKNIKFTKDGNRMAELGIVLDD